MEKSGTIGNITDISNSTPQQVRNVSSRKWKKTIPLFPLAAAYWGAPFAAPMSADDS